MALLGAETVRQAFPPGSGDEEVLGGAAAPVFLAADKDSRPVDPMIWSDEKRMKRELVAWAKAVASMTVTSKNTPSPSSIRHRG
ncbi:hypothetical protein PR202_gb17458 [Eleusine coracana subsp. coracana]|uniref:Uncharacterized protein n=1 Tax=Eleusine coracana subsp. coracana TaxID=191504 RepID=A0AAV5F4T2_ELECO|nr:hypothetical protein QOZ80_6BG0465980 [Eleusine coracana subsp. coracana]GJN29251.1 hypothetical protein PR202_gb17458 [Eleusine coracana subsp. coracana]